MAGTARPLVLMMAAGMFLMPTTTVRAASADKPSQEMLTLPVRVVDAEGRPVENAVVIPWALRCSQGHGRWHAERVGGVEPLTLSTDAEGNVNVTYPRYTILDEGVATLEVTLSIDHPDFPYISHEFINVPRQEVGPHTVTLQRGAVLEVVPLENGKAAPLDGVYAMWSDGRSWRPGISPTITADGGLRIPTMQAGKGQILLARLKGERATHFSEIVDLDLEAGANVLERVELRPAVQIEGLLSENVPRPVKNGRLSARTLPKENSSYDVNWFTWAPVNEEGTFVIESWPAGEDIQIIALCDGYMAESGQPPAVVKNPGRPDAYCRPQVFSPSAQPIVLLMTPTVRCIIETVDEQGSPLAGVKVTSNPNVGWWNGGSQIYCEPLLHGECLLMKRDYQLCVDHSYSDPYSTVTGADGRAELELPAGRESLSVGSDNYELPVVQGRRRQSVTLTAGQTATARLVLQPKGTERLGDWDKLTGVLFGCTGEQCRRLLNDPGFRAKMENVRQSLNAAEDPTDPVLLTAAYLQVADAFEELEDKQEAAKWRIKAAQQAAKLMPSGKKGASVPKQ